MILMASKLLNCDTREFVPWTPRCRAVLVPPYVNTVCAEWYVHLNFVGIPIEYIHYKSAVAWFIGNRIPVIAECRKILLQHDPPSLSGVLNSSEVMC